MNIFSFEGRVSRAHWWAVTVIVMFATIGLSVVFALTIFAAGLASMGGTSAISIVGYVLFLAFAYISIVNGVKRYHDRGKSGWWILIGLIPVIGWLWQTIELGFLKGTEGDNAYGVSPYAPAVIPPAQPSQSAPVAPMETSTVPPVTSSPETPPAPATV